MDEARGSSAATTEPIEYVTWDAEPMETSLHMVALATTVLVLRAYFRDRPDVYPIGSIFWFYEEGNPKARKCPDIMVVRGADPGRGMRDSWKSWEERADPCFILELTSRKTANEDIGNKKDLYHRLGVREYFLFDPTGELLEDSLLGYRLIDGAYELLPPADDGGLLSSELGLRFVPEGPSLALFEFHTGQRLLDLPGLQDEVKRWRRHAIQGEQAERDLKRQNAELERRIQELKAELDRLRAGGQPGGPS